MFRFNKNQLPFLVIFLIFILSASFFIPVLKNTVLDLSGLPLKFLKSTGRITSGLLFFWRNIYENERLQNENDWLKNKLNEANEFSLENKRLNELLSFKQKSPYKVIAARVIAHSPDNWSSAIICDKGANSGVRQGYVVISYLGLVGKVAEVTKFTSKIILINDPNFGVSAIVQRSRQEGLATGALGGFLSLKYLPADADVAEGDVVVTSGLTDSFPKGLLIGIIAGVGQESSGLSRYALVKPAVKLTNLEEVLIIVP